MVYASVPIPIENHNLWAGIVPVERTSPLGDSMYPLTAASAVGDQLNRIVQQSVELCRVRYARILTLVEGEGYNFEAVFSGDPFLWPACLRRTRVPQSAQIIYHSAALRDTPMMIGREYRVPQSIRLALHMAANDCLYLLPMRAEGEALGVLVLGEDAGISSARGNLEERLRLAAMIADQAAGVIHRARLAHRLAEEQQQTVLALARLMEARDPYIGRHCQSVTNVAVRLAVRLGCTSAEIQTIRFAAMLHDIGKVGIHDDILNKRGPLSAGEWEIIRNHPLSGAEVLRVHSTLRDVAQLTEAHHEWFNGAGYPFGLRGESIPLGARILAVADAFSAMTDERPYRTPATIEAAAAELERFSGTQFDPQVVEVFLALYRARNAPLE